MNIKQIQTLLQALGCSPDEIDWIWGAHSITATAYASQIVAIPDGV